MIRAALYDRSDDGERISLRIALRLAECVSPEFIAARIPHDLTLHEQATDGGLEQARGFVDDQGRTWFEFEPDAKGRPCVTGVALLRGRVPR